MTGQAPAVILDLCYAGYGTARVLAPHGVPLIGLLPEGFYPEQGTRLCQRLLRYRDDRHLLEVLQELADECPTKPVLYLTSDLHVHFVARHRDAICQRYLIDFPDQQTIDLLIDKHAFYHFAGEHDILVPRTLELPPAQGLQAVPADFPFPAILKPCYRTAEWMQRVKEKAFLLQSVEELKACYEHVGGIGCDLLLQEYVPGGDDQVVYCLAYLDDASQVVGSFTGAKIRQWPVQTGSTASTKPVHCPEIETETRRILQLVAYQGFGSIEYKRHTENGRYYLIEPTVGRMNQQELVAGANGVNLQWLAYCRLTNRSVASAAGADRPVIYIDLLNELRSGWRHRRLGQLSWREWWRSLRGRRIFRLLTWSDPRVALYLVWWLVRKVWLRGSA